MKYAHIEKYTNKLLGWYSKDIHSEIPTPNIEVSEQVWREAIDISANCYEDGKFLVKDFRTSDEIRLQDCNKQIADANEYLRSTGWLIERFNDPSSGKAIPEYVLTKRAEARELINTLEAELILLQEVK